MTPLHCGISRPSMSALGESRHTNEAGGFVQCPLYPQQRTSPPPSSYVRFVPRTDSRTAAKRVGYSITSSASICIELKARCNAEVWRSAL